MKTSDSNRIVFKSLTEGELDDIYQKAVSSQMDLHFSFLKLLAFTENPAVADADFQRAIHRISQLVDVAHEEVEDRLSTLDTNEEEEA